MQFTVRGILDWSTVTASNKPNSPAVEYYTIGISTLGVAVYPYYAVVG